MIDVSTITVADFKAKYPDGLAGYPYLPVWDSATNYVVDNLVYLNGVFYDCILDNTNQTPPNATYWTVNTTAQVYNYISDQQITDALCQAQVQFAECLLSKKDDFVKLYYCYLVAHIIVFYEIPMAQQSACLSEVSTGTVTSQSAGDISVSMDIPTSVTSSSFMTTLNKTIYGQRYAAAIEGCAIGYFGFVGGSICD